ncbi:hypothetical protein SALWKB2_1813 [Snodgrassella alvi wkB2]|nr:hypothetical protein SALWKB2_1813 [Snodgrassella alvi wkB2]
MIQPAIILPLPADSQILSACNTASADYHSLHHTMRYSTFLNFSLTAPVPVLVRHD